jgi:hypothetical protein
VTDARLVELWLRLTADALHGADDAQRALASLGASPMSSDSLSAWMKLWLSERPSGSGRFAEAEVSEFGTLVESWWRLLGVVPRYEYDDLRRRHEQLLRRLEEAGATIERLRGRVSSTGHDAEAQAMLDAWERMSRDPLEAQSEWTRRFMHGWGAEERDDDQHGPDGPGTMNDEE